MLHLVLVIPVYSFHDLSVLQVKNGPIDTPSLAHQATKTNSLNFFLLNI